MRSSSRSHDSMAASMDPYAFLHISLNSDGSSLTRAPVAPLSPPSGELAAAGDAPAISKDVTLNPSTNTWARIFLPRGAAPCQSEEKLPVLFYFHASGFICFSAATTPFHDSCARMSAEIPALVVSVDYRLAPEHRLPAAYDDALDALLWARQQAQNPSAADPWLAARADWSRCFLMGSSSGGNIAYHAAVRAAEHDLLPLKLEGVIMNQPYFGGEERTESELKLAEDKILPLPANDLMWELSLPKGATRGHEYCDVVRRASPLVQAGAFPRCLMNGYVGDPLIDRQREVARMLEERGVQVVAKLEEEGFHGVDLFRPDKEAATLALVKVFICDDGGGGGIGGQRP